MLNLYSLKRYRVFHDRDILSIENISKELINSLPYVEFDLKKKEQKRGGVE